MWVPTRQATSHLSLVTSVAMTNEAVITAGIDTDVLVWQLGAGVQQSLKLTGHTCGVCSVDIKENMLGVVTLDGATRIWDLRTSKVAATLQSSPGNAQVCSWVDDTLVTAGIDGIVSVWNGEEPDKPTKETKLDSAILCLASEGNLAAFGNEEGYVGIYDVAKNETRSVKMHTKAVRSMAFVDGKIFSSSDDHFVCVSDPDKITGDSDKESALITSFSGHHDMISTIVLSPARPNICMTGSADCTVNFWDWSERKIVMDSKQHTAGVWCGAASQNGNLFVSGGRDSAFVLYRHAEAEA